VHVPAALLEWFAYGLLLGGGGAGPGHSQLPSALAATPLRCCSMIASSSSCATSSLRGSSYPRGRCYRFPSCVLSSSFLPSLSPFPFSFRSPEAKMGVKQS